MDDLVQWLRDQLDEDERIARAASDGPWRSYRGPERQWLSKGDLIHPVYTWDRAVGTPVIMTAFWADSRHIAEWNPQQVLREIEAKRLALNHYAELQRFAKGGVAIYRTAAGAVAMQIQIMALPYADRSGYREEWRPSE